ncbi:MAG: NusG domain II-containing protein [Anaerotignaceae bacterium]
MKKWDIIIILVALIMAGGLYFSGILRPSQLGATAIIYVDGEIERKLNLIEEKTITIETDEGYNIIEVKDGVISVTDADCNDKICVNHKAINLVNENITCLPHKMVIEIQGTNESEVDAIAQ